jgi:chromosomal replication initiator protein
MTAEMVDIALADLLPQPANLKPEKIIDLVARTFNLTVERLTSSDRSREVSLPRQIAMFLLRETNVSLPQIGHVLGGRDHTTVMYACDKVADMIERDDRMRRQVAGIRQQLHGQTAGV